MNTSGKFSLSGSSGELTVCSSKKEHSGLNGSSKDDHSFFQCPIAYTDTASNSSKLWDSQIALM